MIIRITDRDLTDEGIQTLLVAVLKMIYELEIASPLECRFAYAHEHIDSACGWLREHKDDRSEHYAIDAAMDLGRAIKHATGDDAAYKDARAFQRQALGIPA